MNANEHVHAPRQRFDTLFADPRHYRGDCRLMRTAVRRGWLDDMPQDVRDALIERFERAIDEREAAGFVSDGQRIRTVFAQVRAGLEAVKTNQRADVTEWQAERFGRTTTIGRPRKRLHVGDFAQRLDVNEIRRQAQARGFDLRAAFEISVRREGELDERISVTPHGRDLDRARAYFRCPKCRRLKVQLYSMADGYRCRNCAQLRYTREPTKTPTQAS